MKSIFNRPALKGSSRGGFAFGKLLAFMIALGVVGGGAWGGKQFLNKEEEKVRKERYYVAKMSDFLVTVKLTGQLVSTDVEVLKCELEGGGTTIETIVDEGTQVKGPTTYTVEEGDTIESIAEYQSKDLLCIKQLNKDLELNWDTLESGTEIQIPGDLLIELDPLMLKERINSQEIAVQRAENSLSRAIGNRETLVLASELALKVAQNNYTNALMDLDKLKNNTIETYIKNTEISIKNYETDVQLAEKNLTAYNKLKELGFVSDLEVLREQSKRDKTLHQIKVLRDDLNTYLKYDQKSLLSAKELSVDECDVQTKKTKVMNKANAADADSSVLTSEKTLELEKEKLEDLLEQMANTKIYAPQEGTVLYYSHRYERGEPIVEGAKVYRGRNLIKLPKTDSLKVDLSVPQAKRSQLRVGMRVYVEVEDVKLPGTLAFLSPTVDTNRRGHTDKSYFKGEVSIDSPNLPDSVSEGMAVTVELLVIKLEGENQRIKIPNQCVTTRMISEDTPERGCWVLDPHTKEHSWRPVTIEYSDENFIAVQSETEPGRGLKEGELVHLSPLTEAENLNLEEAVMGKGELNFDEIPSIPLPDKESEKTIAKEPIKGGQKPKKGKKRGPPKL